MLDTLRKSVGSWVVKALIALLVVSFAVWGISDVFTGYRGQSLARVGDTEISQQDFQRAQQAELRALSAEANRNLSLSEAKLLGLDQRVMLRLIGGAALDSQARTLSLGISDAGMIETIFNDPNFKDATGNFNRVIFDQVLRANGLTEQTYITTQRQHTLRGQLLETFGGVPVLPQTLVAAIDRYNNESRILRYVVVPESAAGTVSEPTDEDLKRYYDNNTRLFTDPEYRKIGVLAVTPDVVRHEVKVTEEQIKAAYEAKKDSLGKPERRHIQQITFPGEAEAKAAREKIEQGADFIEVGKEQGFSEEDIDLGMLREDQLADPAIGAAAFRLSENEVSQPVAGKFGGTALVRVTGIEPGVVKLYEEAKAELEREIVKLGANSFMLDLHDRIEDLRGGGATLPEVAQELKLDYVEIDAVDRQGQDPKQNTVQIPARSEVVALAFESDAGLENDPVDLHDEGFVWVEVLGVTPPELKPFEQVRDEVVRRWRADQERSQVAKFAQELVDKLRDGESLDEVAKSLDAEVTTTRGLRRDDVIENVTASAVGQAFALPERGYGSAPAGKGASRIVFQVDRIWIPPAPAPETAKELDQQVTRMVEEDLRAQYVTGLQSRYGVDVNQKALERLLGGGSTE